MRFYWVPVFCVVSLGSVAGWADEFASVPELSFDRIWEQVKLGAPTLKAAGHELEAAQIAKMRAARHWYPHLYLTGKAFSTNDPGAVFMNSLGQRSIRSGDFVPSSLNQPGSQFFEQGTLGLNFPLYEGGMRVAQSEAAGKGVEAGLWESKALVIDEYAHVAKAYATLLVLLEQRKHLIVLDENVSGVIGRYRIGANSNPVGYSGLLGLKNLRNRVEGLLVENEAKADATRIEIRTLAADLPDAWRPTALRAKDFLNRIFPKSHFEGEPAAVRAARARVEALERTKVIERARFLPRLGLFAQGDLYAGNRSSATSYSTGAYLQWDLFTAGNFGAVAESTHLAAAALARAEGLGNKMKGDLISAESGTIAAEKNLALLDESARLLEEQTLTARSLFRNGSINALQLVEVLSRRADLLVNRSEVEMNLTQMKASGFLATAREGVPDDHLE